MLIKPSIIVAKDCDQSGISDSYDVTAERPASANYYASPSVELRNAGRLIRFVVSVAVLLLNCHTRGITSIDFNYNCG
jgi:hypothetical protein